jgi:outer membrane protein TolC
MNRSRPIAPVPVPLPVRLLLALAAGCSTESYAADADREVEDILGQSHTEVLGDREQRVIRPEPEKPAAPAPAPTEPSGNVPPSGNAPPANASAPPAPPPPAQTIDLAAALATAFRDNRDYISRKESLYRQGLSISLARFNYGPLWRSTVSSVWNEVEDAIGTANLLGSLGVSQILPTGGTVSVDSTFGNTWFERAANSRTFSSLQYNSSLSLNVTQPLLRGGGYEVSHEGLTQAERDLVYAIRDFELFRENFSITIARSFFDLVGQQQTLGNVESNARQAVFDRRKAEALLQVDRNNDQEVYRARRREIDAQNQLLDARTAYQRARDQFKVQLGMATSTPVEIASQDPPFVTVRLDRTSAVEAAKHNRLDLLTERERLEDTERSVRLAENAILPQLDMNLGLGFGHPPDTSLVDALPDRWNASAAVTMEIPLQRKAERNSLRSSQLALDQARRDYTQRLDQVQLDIEDQLRSLRRLEQQIDLQREQITQEQRAVTVTEIRYQAGDLDNRDLLEARQALFNAQNALITLSAQHFVARLTLMRDLGLLFVDDQGVWR